MSFFPKSDEQAVVEFIELYREEYGEDLSCEEAVEKAASLLDLYKLLFFDA